MSPATLVVPFADGLLARVRQHPLVIRLNDEHDINPALDAVARHRLHLQGLWVETPRPLGAIDLRERWAEANLALFVPSTGPYIEVRRQLPLLVRPGLRVYLPATSEANLLSVRILASLGVQTAIILHGPGVQWGPLGDLAAYALLRAGTHATIEPFTYIASSYSEAHPTDYSAVYFDAPQTYLHMDEGGRVALSADAARQGEFVAASIEKLAEIEQTPAFVDRTKAWRASFPDKAQACSSCEGWGLCRGRFAAAAERGAPCREFFAQILDTLKQTQARKDQGKHSWPP